MSSIGNFLTPLKFNLLYSPLIIVLPNNSTENSLMAILIKLDMLDEKFDRRFTSLQSELRNLLSNDYSNRVNDEDAMTLNTDAMASSCKDESFYSSSNYESSFIDDNSENTLESSDTKTERDNQLEEDKSFLCSETLSLHNGLKIQISQDRKREAQGNDQNKKNKRRRVIVSDTSEEEEV